LSRLRPGRDYTGGRWSPAQLDLWAAAIARSQLEAVESNLVAIDRLVALVPSPRRRAEYSDARLDRLRAAMLERGFEWQKRLARVAA
jgi:hypothetical protein